MEGKRMAGSSSSSSSSSLVSELFGRKDSSGKSSTSSGIFGSIFPPTSLVMESESSHSYNSNTKTAAVAASETESKPSKWHKSLQSNVNNSTFHAGKTDPCYLSSSVFYGGQDFCSHPSSSSSNSVSSYVIDKHYQYKKDGERDSDPVDSRGDWWQGSLYY